MVCEKQISKKYAVRKSPPYPANSCCGEIKKGNDGNDYSALADKNGRCRWILLTKGKSWLTHDNGSRPFKVVEDAVTKKITIFKASSTEPPSYDVIVKEYSPVAIFIGKSPRNPITERSRGYGAKFDGNSILLQLKEENRYVFIGHLIYEFSAPEPIEKYYSAVGNNDVPYPVALSKTFAFFMLDAPRNYKDKSPFKLDYIRKDAFPKNINWSDAYGWYYENFYKNNKDFLPPTEGGRLRVKVINKSL